MFRPLPAENQSDRLTKLVRRIITCQFRRFLQALLERPRELAVDLQLGGEAAVGRHIILLTLEEKAALFADPYEGIGQGLSLALGKRGLLLGCLGDMVRLPDLTQLRGGQSQMIARRISR